MHTLNNSVAALSHVPCRFFKAGACTAGESCPFSHAAPDCGFWNFRLVHRDLFLIHNCSRKARGMPVVPEGQLQVWTQV